MLLGTQQTARAGEAGDLARGLRLVYEPTARYLRIWTKGLPIIHVVEF